jgi:hypothetical protein
MTDDQQVAEKSRDIDGFIFNTLNQKYPDDKENLAEFKQFLLDKVGSLLNSGLFHYTLHIYVLTINLQNVNNFRVTTWPR